MQIFVPPPPVVCSMEQLRAIQKRQGPLAAARRVDMRPRTAVTGWVPVGRPSTVVVKHNASEQGTCWEGYHRVKGTKQYADDSCAKDGSSDRKKKKKRRKKKSGDSGSETDTSSSSGGD